MKETPPADLWCKPCGRSLDGFKPRDPVQLTVVEDAVFITVFTKEDNNA